MRKSIKCFGVLVLLAMAACGESPTRVVAPESPRFDGGLLAGSSQEVSYGNTSPEISTTEDSETERGGLVAGSGN